MINWKNDDRPQLYGWAPGGYLFKCLAAGCADKSDDDKIHIGDKRATMCADCAYALKTKLDLESVSV